MYSQRRKRHKAQNLEEKEEPKTTQESKESKESGHSRRGYEYRHIHGPGNVNNNDDELMDMGYGEKVNR